MPALANSLLWKCNSTPRAVPFTLTGSDCYDYHSHFLDSFPFISSNQTIIQTVISKTNKCSTPKHLMATHFSTEKCTGQSSPTKAAFSSTSSLSPKGQSNRSIHQSLLTLSSAGTPFLTSAGSGSFSRFPALLC